MRRPRIFETLEVRDIGVFRKPIRHEFETDLAARVGSPRVSIRHLAQGDNPCARKGLAVLGQECHGPHCGLGARGQAAEGLHSSGLRKTLDESGAITRQRMDVLGHRDIRRAELQLREGEDPRLAIQGRTKVIDMELRCKNHGEPIYPSSSDNCPTNL